MLICALPPDSELWNACIDLMNSYPHFPMLFILAQDSVIESKIVLDGFHKLLRPLTNKKTFLRKIKDLVQVGRWTEMEDVTAATAIPQFFDSLDINHVVDRLLQHFGQQIECSNIFWLQSSELERFVEAREGSHELEESQRYNRSAFLQALHDATENEVFNVLKHFPLSQKYFGKSVSLSNKDSYGRDHLIVPIPGTATQPVPAYLVFENVQSENPDFLMSQVNETLALLSDHIRYSLEYWNVQSQTFMDDLTTLYNQKYLGLVLDNEINRASRKKEKFSVLFLDVDFFKMVNDTRGHWIGSKVLIELGKLLKETVRTCDYAFRYGGDEYVMILPDTDKAGAEIVAERIRELVERTTFQVDDFELNITVSIGLATYPDHAENQKDIIRMADEAMYCGKNKSRNIVYVAG